MKSAKQIATIISLNLCLVFCAASPLNAQSSIDSNVEQAYAGKLQQMTTKVSTFFSGSDDVKKTYYNRNRSKVTVTIADFAQQEQKLLAASISSFFKGKADLQIEDLTFTPDFEDGFFYLSFSTPKEDDTKILILDVAGREIHSETISKFTGIYESKINIPAENKGTFFLKIIQGMDLLNKKLVVE